MKLGYDFQKKSYLDKRKKLIDSRYNVSFQSSHTLLIIYDSWFLLLFLFIYFFVISSQGMGMIICPIYNPQIMNI